MKKLLAILIVLAMLFSLAACGGGNSKAAEQPSEEAVTEAAEPAADAAEPAAEETAEQAEAPSDATEEAAPEQAADEVAEVAESIASVDGSNPVGTYKIISMVQEDESVDEDTLKQMEAAGMICTLKLAADGNGNIDIFGDINEFTWADGKIKVDENEVPFTLEDGILSMEADGASMTFRKVSDEIIDLKAETVDYVAQAAALSDAAPGTYQLHELINDGEPTDPETIQLMNAMGLTCAVLLKEDGTGSIYLFGGELELTWDDANLTFDGDAVPYTLKDHIITLEQDNTKMSFIKTSDDILEFGDVDLSALTGGN